MHDPALRPENLRRSLLHVCSAVSALVLLRYVFSPAGIVAFAVGFACFAWTLEITRRRWSGWNGLLMRWLGTVAHAHEAARVNSSTWYATAMAIIAVVFTPVACAVGIAVLGLGDPAAGFVGRRWGTVKLAAGRSLEGTLAFVVVGGLGAFVALRIGWPELGVGSSVALATMGAAFGAAAEVGSRRVDDNFAVPIAAALGAMIAA
jgi:dolichol kinase